MLAPYAEQVVQLLEAVLLESYKSHIPPEFNPQNTHSIHPYDAKPINIG